MKSELNFLYIVVGCGCKGGAWIREEGEWFEVISLHRREWCEV